MLNGKTDTVLTIIQDNIRAIDSDIASLEAKRQRLKTALEALTPGAEVATRAKRIGRARVFDKTYAELLLDASKEGGPLMRQDLMARVRRTHRASVSSLSGVLSKLVKEGKLESVMM